VLWHGALMSADAQVTAAERVALMQAGIVVLKAEERPESLLVSVTGGGEERVREAVARMLGQDVEVDWLGDLPRRLEPLRCRGYMEREPGRLQVRFALCGDEHIVDEIMVAEDESAVVVFATVCTAAAGEAGEWCEGPWHVYLEQPLGDRTVIDGTCGRAVPYKNVWAEIEAEEATARRRAARSRRRGASGGR
jgi:hypothetical protein